MVISKSRSENYCTEISNQTAIIFSDVKEDKGGSGRYFRPDELLCSSLASCLNMTIRMGLDHRKIEYDQIVVKVDLDQSDENKTKFLIDVDVTGGISEETRQLVKRLAGACPIRKALSKQIEFEAMQK
ncbi:OsmC family peroxiredoxin [Caproiciproducens sp. NJN-50]|uniref:OsmC family protein n=1 Tax=Acutalibacteraceae TaxID=3082771 RepID=UPI000FFE0635|nr:MULTISPECIES: OsmC family protein [Acutalibacteraceae]QAT48842.1 OsmC family peroxiredoxin [Caproiciproducens sp. NJN-50]